MPTVLALAPAEGGTGAHSHELFLQDINKYLMSKHSGRGGGGGLRSDTLKFK